MSTDTCYLFQTHRRLTHELKHVEPKRAILNISSPCQQQCAYIRNRAVDAIADKDMVKIRNRLLQSKRGKRNVFFEGVGSFILLVILMLNLALLSHSHQNRSSGYRIAYLLIGILASILGLNIHIQIGNFTRYRKTQIICADWIRENYSDSVLQGIEKISSHDIDNMQPLDERIISQRTVDVDDTAVVSSSARHRPLMRLP